MTLRKRIGSKSRILQWLIRQEVLDKLERVKQRRSIKRRNAYYSRHPDESIPFSCQQCGFGLTPVQICNRSKRKYCPNCHSPLWKKRTEFADRERFKSRKKFKAFLFGIDWRKVK